MASQIEALVALLLGAERPRLVTLPEPGGIGKTRLAIEAASQLESLFDDGVCLVSIAPVNDVELVAVSVAEVIGLREGESLPIRERLVGVLSPRRLLLILDSFEHLVAATPLVT